MFLANDSNGAIFLSFIPEIMFWIISVVFLLYAFKFCVRLIKMCSLKKEKNYKEISFNKLLFSISCTLYISLLIFWLTATLIKFVLFKYISNPIYITEENWKFFFPLGVFITGNVALYVYEYMFGNSLLIIEIEDQFLFWKERVLYRNILTFEKNNKWFSLSFNDFKTDEKINLNIWDKKTILFLIDRIKIDENNSFKKEEN